MTKPVIIRLVAMAAMLLLPYNGGAAAEEPPGAPSAPLDAATSHDPLTVLDQPVAPAPALELSVDLNSTAALVLDQRQGHLLYAKDADHVRPIASITKLMTAMVVLDSGAPLHESIRIRAGDIDTMKGSRSRLKVGIALSRGELLKLALMASENRAAAALARSYPGGAVAFVVAMNRKARQLGMLKSHFVDSTGLDPANVSNAIELAMLADAAYQYPVIRQFTTMRSESIKYALSSRKPRGLLYRNSNRLVLSSDWQIGLSKTGYTREAGRCLVLQSSIAGRPLVIVLLNAHEKESRLADANQLRRWLSRTPDASSISGGSTGISLPARMAGVAGS